MERGERDEFCRQVDPILLRVHPKGPTGEGVKQVCLFCIGGQTRVCSSMSGMPVMAVPRIER